MGWQDAPIVGSDGGTKKAAWESAPIVGATQPTSTPQQPPQNMGAFASGNIWKGVADIAGMPVDLVSAAVEGTKGAANLFGAHLKEKTPIGGSEWIKQKLTDLGAIGPSAEPRTLPQKLVAGGLEGLPSAVVPGGAARALPRLGAAIGGGIGGAAGEAVGGAPGQIAGSLLGGGLGGMAGAERAIPKPPSEAARASRASGIPLTVGQETGNAPLQFTENRLRELFPSKGTARTDELTQVQAGITRVNQLADQISAPQGVPGELLQTNIGEKLRAAYQATVKKIDGLRDAQAQRDYGEVKRLAGSRPIINYQNTMATLDKIIAENENVPSADSKKILEQARSIKNALTVKQPGSTLVGPSGQPLTPPTVGAATHTIDDAMKTRSAWGKAARRSGNIFSDIDSNANQVLAKRLFGAINRDFDAASTAQTPIAQALRAANDNYRKASQSLTFVEKSALGKLLGQDVADAAFTGVQGSTKAPEAIAKKYLSMTPSQAKSVTAILQLHQPEVLQDAKAFVLRNALEEAASGAPGAAPISFAKFRSQIDKVQGNLSAMGFADKEIKDLKDVTDTMARAGDRTGINPSGTTGAAHMLSIPALAVTHPLGAVLAVGGPFGLSKLLLTESGRDLLRAAMTSGKGQAAAIGALRSQLTALGQDRSPRPTPQASTSTQLPPPPQ